MAKPLEPSVKQNDKLKRSKSFSKCKMVKRVRIVCTDPYATESSSDEAESEVVRRRKIVREISFRDPLCLEWSSVEGCRRDGKKPKKRVLAKAPLALEGRVLQDFDNRNAKQRPNRSLYRGVRKRKSGKWAAEIRNPLDQKRLWLGTYNSAEEASRVYEAKRQEFASKARNMSKYNSAKKVGGLSDDVASRFLKRQLVVPEDSESTLADAFSPSSVLELKTSAGNDNFSCDGFPKECEEVDDCENNEVMEGHHRTADSLTIEDPFLVLNSIPLDPEIDSPFFDDFRNLHEFSDHHVFPVYDLELKGDVQLHDYSFHVEEFPPWMNLSPDPSAPGA